MVRIDDRGRHLRREVGRHLGRLDGADGRQFPGPLASPTKAIATRHDAEVLLGGLEGLRVGEPLTLPNQPRRSGMYLKLGDRYGTTGEGGFEECDGGWNATARRTNALPITTNDALSTPRTQSRVKSGEQRHVLPGRVLASRGTGPGMR